MLTEEQAKEKFCPVARVIKTNGAAELVAGNRDSEDQPLGNCIASECMAWRIAEMATHDVDTGKEIHPERGYCGLAGQIAGAAV